MTQVALAPEEGASNPLHRPVAGAWVGGVCAGISRRLGWPVLVVRLFFMAASAWKLSGLFLYGALWAAIPRQEPGEAIGIAAATRDGRRTAVTHPWVTVLLWGLLMVYGLALGVLMARFEPGRLGFLALTLIVGGIGVALVWRQWDHADTLGRWQRLLLGIGGAVVAVGSVAVTIGWRFGWRNLPFELAFAGGGLLLGFLLVVPWLTDPWRRSRAAQEAEIRAEARADVAAHLHDSVLQTLALIQRRSDDSKLVARLARSQERELRQWLYGEAVEEGTLTSALKREAAEVEDAYGIAIDIVTVGDAPITPELEALVQAAGEAILNAAKHSGAALVNVYAEIGDQVADVFVRDHGRGFDPEEIGADRMGLRRSIIDRMHRYGGVVQIRSTPGEGTEIHLEMAR
jgi:signal transduction histidine kinase